MEAGDPAFWKMLLDRVWPAPKSVEISGPEDSDVSFRWMTLAEVALKRRREMESEDHRPIP